MNKHTSLITGIILGLLFLTNGALAQVQRYTPTTEVLEFSLMRLKQSSQQVKEKNDWLANENKSLRNKILQLETQMSMLDKKQEELNQHKTYIEGRSAKVSDVAAAKQNVARIQREISNLKARNQEFDRQVVSRKATEGNLRKAVFAFRQDIKNLNNQLITVNDSLSKKQENEEVKQLLATLALTEKDTAKVKRDYIQIKKRHSKPKQNYDDLVDQKNGLQRELDILAKRYEETLDEERKILKDLEILEMGSSDDLSRLNDSIQILSLRERKLNELLSTVENTVNEKNIDLSSSLESADVLKENLVIIEKENSNLREEMSSLKKTLKRLQNTQNNDT